MLTADLLVPRTTQLCGLDVTYYDSEDEGRHPGETLVMIHGTGGTTAGHFGYLFPVLAAKQRVLAFDWADPTGGDRKLELEDLVEQAIEGIEKLAAGTKVTLMGYSLGACVVTAVAARRPDLVSKLITLCGWAKTDVQQEIRNSVWEQLRALDDDSALRRYSVFCAFSGEWLTQLPPDMLPQMYGAFGFTPFIDAQMELNRRVDIVDELEKITAPTLVMSCTRDIMVPTRHQKQLFGGIDNARFVEMASGHGVVFERPSEICNHVQEILDHPDKYAAGTIIPTPQP